MSMTQMQILIPITTLFSYHICSYVQQGDTGCAVVWCHEARLGCDTIVEIRITTTASIRWGFGWGGQTDGLTPVTSDPHVWRLTVINQLDIAVQKQKCRIQTILWALSINVPLCYLSLLHTLVKLYDVQEWKQIWMVILWTRLWML